MGEVALAASGRVKWYDHARGFGFVISEAFDGDALIHHSVLKEFGKRSVPDGATVEFTFSKRPRGLQIDRVTRLDCSTAMPPRKELTRNVPHPETAGEWEPVTVKWFSEYRGYGFLQRQDGADVFVHALTFREAMISTPEPGQFLEARICEGEKGLAAAVLRSGGQARVGDSV